MKKAERKAKVEEIITEIDSFMDNRKDSYERSIEDLAEIRQHIDGIIQGLKCDILHRDGK